MPSNIIPLFKDSDPRRFNDLFALACQPDSPNDSDDDDSVEDVFDHINHNSGVDNATY